MTNANLISQYRAKVSAMLNTFADCKSLEDVITSQGGSSIFKPSDFTGANADLTPEDFTSIIVSREAIDKFVVDGSHLTNLCKALS